jgi:hypothetical protein
MGGAPRTASKTESRSANKNVGRVLVRWEIVQVQLDMGRLGSGHGMVKVQEGKTRASQQRGFDAVLSHASCNLKSCVHRSERGACSRRTGRLGHGHGAR